jgi:phage terminase small subunit
MGVNEKMNKKFLYAEARASGKCRAEAARMAGYSEATSQQAGSRLEKDPEVIGYMATMRRVIEPPTPVVVPDNFDPLEMMKKMANDLSLDPRVRLDALKSYASFTVAKPGEKGKKEMSKEKAEEVSKRFVAAMPPSLRAV